MNDLRCPMGHPRVSEDPDEQCAHEVIVGGVIDLYDADGYRYVGDDISGWLGECWSPTDRRWTREEIADEYGDVREAPAIA